MSKDYVEIPSHKDVWKAVRESSKLESDIKDKYPQEWRNLQIARNEFNQVLNEDEYYKYYELQAFIDFWQTYHYLQCNRVNKIHIKEIKKEE